MREGSLEGTLLRHAGLLARPTSRLPTILLEYLREHRHGGSIGEDGDAGTSLRQGQLGRYAAAMTDREARIAKNEAIVREINEGIEESKASRTPEGDAPVMCECGNLDCELLIAITVSEYEDVRQNARRFVVVKDHVIPDVEQVVAETERFAVVEKREGTSAEVAEATDPRD